jgi:hypothetical protein
MTLRRTSLANRPPSTQNCTGTMHRLSPLLPQLSLPLLRPARTTGYTVECSKWLLRWEGETAPSLAPSRELCEGILVIVWPDLLPETSSANHVCCLGLYLAGHSLGAGVASLLGLIWANPETSLTSSKSGLPTGRKIKIYGFATP